MLSFVVVAFILYLRGIKLATAAFHLIASALEQDNFHLQNGEISTSALILIWAFSLFLFRNLYTFTLYTHLTAQPLANNVPKSIYQVYHEPNLLVLSFFRTALALRMEINNISLAGSKLDGLYKQILKATKVMQQVDKIFDFDASTDAFIKQANQNSLKCKSMSSNSWFQTGDKLKNCDVSSRFTMLYNTEERNNQIPSRIPKMLYKLSGRTLIEKESREAFLANINVWRVNGIYLISENIKNAIGQLVESEIYNLWKKVDQTKQLYGTLSGPKMKKIFNRTDLQDVNLLDYAVKMVTGCEEAPKPTRRAENMKLQSLYVVALVCLCLITSCMLIILCEVLWSK